MIPQNIKINNVRSLDAKLVQDEYFDYMLYKGEVYGPSPSEDECLASFVDFTDPESYTSDGSVQSVGSWDGSISNGIVLEHIGMTGTDNGLIHYDKDLITNEIFYNLFFNGKLTIDSGDTKFYLTPVTGNTKEYCYDYSIEEEDGKKYMAFKGGFLQGFFKLEGYDYQVLPSYIDNDWHFEFVIRPRSDYEECETSLNHKYPDNSGYFFYIGTRAEHKFAEIMNKTDEFTCNYTPSFVKDLKSVRYYHFEDPNIYDDEDIDFFSTQEHEEAHSGDTDTYEDAFLNDAAEAIEAYLYEEYEIDPSQLSLSAATGYTEIETDNKFVFFNRTCTGFTVHNWDLDIDKIVLTGHTRGEYKENAFLLFNRTCTGLTAHDVDEYFEANSDDYDIQKDVIGNAFALKYYDDGSIEYQYTMKDCDDEKGWSQQSERTVGGLIHDGEWNVVNVRFAILDNSYKTCVSTDDSGNTIYTKVPNHIGSRKMKIMIYVNGFLVLVSKELNEFNFRGFKDQKERQEAVPYNISLGGGTQGLGERIWPDFRDPVECHYFLENTYAGSFAGDMKLFKMYECRQNYPTILRNYKKYIGEDYYTGDTIDVNHVYVGSGLDYQSVVKDSNKHIDFEACMDTYTITVTDNASNIYLMSPVSNRKAVYEKLSIGDVDIQCDIEIKEINNIRYKVFKSKAVYPAGVRLVIKASKKD